MATKKLFQPLRLGNVTLDHRVTMAALTRFRADENQVPSELAKIYYGQRASVKGTLIVTEATVIAPKAGGYPAAPGIWSKEQIQGWKDITRAVHEKGSFIFLQLWALGRIAPSAALEPKGFVVQGPSAIPYAEGQTTPTPLTKEQIKSYVQDFAQAARNAMEAGFDGVEVHGANGYLVDQFWQDVSNDRNDEYGGSIENRARFGLEVTRAVIDAVGDSKKVGIRLSPFGTFQGMRMKDPIPQFSYITQELRKLDLAYLSLIESQLSGSSAPVQEYADNTRENDALVQIWGKNKPVIFAGGFTSAKADRVAEDYYPEHQVMIAFGRHFISTPDLVQRLKDNAEMNKYDRSTFYGGDAKGYIDYPFAHEIKA